MEFEIDDIFETGSGILWRVSGVIHDSKLVYARDEESEEIEFSFSEITDHWSKVT